MVIFDLRNSKVLIITYMTGHTDIPYNARVDQLVGEALVRILWSDH